MWDICHHLNYSYSDGIRSLSSCIWMKVDTFLYIWRKRQIGGKFRERGKLAVNSKKEANLLSIQRKSQLTSHEGCWRHFRMRMEDWEWIVERMEDEDGSSPPSLLQPHPEVPSISYSLSLPFIFIEREVGWIITGGSLTL